MPQRITLGCACAANALLTHCSRTACVLSGGSRVAAARHAVRALARPGGEEKKRRPSSGAGRGGGCGGPLAASCAHPPRIARLIVPPRGDSHPHSCRPRAHYSATSRLGPGPAHVSRSLRRVQHDQWSLRRGPLRVPRGLDGLELRRLPCGRHLLLRRRGRVRRARRCATARDQWVRRVRAGGGGGAGPTCSCGRR